MGAHNVLPQVVVAVRRVQNICLCQQHQLVVLELHSPDGLGDTESPAIPYIVSSEGLALGGRAAYSAAVVAPCGFVRFHSGEVE